MSYHPVYTIGHGTRKAGDFLNLLKRFGIEYLIDVRSAPYSKYNPQYNRFALKAFLEQHGIRYVFMGDAMGGRPGDPGCYHAEGKVDYSVVKTKEFFRQGIERLKKAHIQGLKVAVMCSESKPCECHRSKLIGEVLRDDGIFLQHIDERGNVKHQIEVMNELNKGVSAISLFGDDPV
ncbi:DUF488 family protein [Pedobacter sp. HMF7056]|uniref:DUF488 family protein n=2 Tax=Hufsiella ginkgonis TaxID=2695274 RepID=A0A7K1XUZ5_9SPHI|nr:DUF488 family protein [Hufsiella ginkgonis]